MAGWRWTIMVLVAACGPKVDDDPVASGGGSGETGGCVGTPPSCDPVPGDCYGERPDPWCVEGEWSCPRAGLVVPPLQCEEVTGDDLSDAEGEAEGEADGPMPSCLPDDLPPDCWDQGPGECSDAALPATCDGVHWVCPPGWDLGGFGDGCTWPSPEGASLDTGSSGDTSGSESSTGGSSTG